MAHSTKGYTISEYEPLSGAMKPTILDLREQHCPLSLLLVKRQMKAMAEGRTLRIFIRDEASFQDIQAFLQLHATAICCEERSDGFQIDVTKGFY